MGVRGVVRRVAVLGFEWSGASRRSRRRLDGSSAAVLMYHRVLPAALARRDAVEPGMYVTPDTFARHLAWLRELFTPLPLHEIATRLAAGRPLPERACAVTFDDGWRDNHDHALPELERQGIPATLFVVSERVGSEGAFWPDEVCRRLAPLARGQQRALAERLGAAPNAAPVDALLDRLKALPEAERAEAIEALRGETPAPPERGRELLDWSELERLARGGVDVESHGATHAILPGLQDAGVEAELRRARETLRAHGHGCHALLAYPSGGYDARVRRIASAAGYRAAVTTQRGLARAGADLMALPRIGMHEDVSSTRAAFLFKVPGAG